MVASKPGIRIASEAATAGMGAMRWRIRGDLRTPLQVRSGEFPRLLRALAVRAGF